MTGPLSYSIIVPAWNESAFIEKTLAALTSAMVSVAEHRGELIVVDNNSSDDTASLASAAGARVVHEPINQIARARNTGARASDTEVLLFIDADSQCDATLLRDALTRLASDEVIGGGATIRADRPVTGAPAIGLQFWNFLSRRLKMAAGCFVYCRRDAFDAVGGFNERVYAGEEIYLSRALKRRARETGQRFEIITSSPIATSVRKLDWYSPLALLGQTLVVLIPGAIYSRRLTRLWYDRRAERR